MDVLDVLVAERGQRALDGLALRVEDPLLGAYQYPDPQRFSQVSKLSPVRRS